jgi:hypothetical protein
LAPLSLEHSLLVDELGIRSPRSEPSDTDTDEVRVLSIELDPFRDLVLVREARVTRVDDDRRPAVTLRPEAGSVKVTGDAGAVPEQEDHRLPVREPTLCHLMDAVADAAVLVEDVEAGGPYSVLTGERL